jgi:S-methylmethionine-dependent homocysteine/selenocysteine methylase
MQYLEAGADIIISSSYQVLLAAFIFRTVDIDQILQFMVVSCLELNRDSNVTYYIHVSLPAGNDPRFPG